MLSGSQDVDLVAVMEFCRTVRSLHMGLGGAAMGVWRTRSRYGANRRIVVA